MKKEEIKNNEKMKKSMQELEKELDTLQIVCFNYKKHKTFNIQLILTVISCIIFYCQQYVLKNNIDIGLSKPFIIFIGVACILTIVLGWINYYLEFQITNEKIFKIGQIVIWIIEAIAILTFVILLFI